MKKFLACAALALAAVALSERRADAWVNSKFSVGLNWQFQSANNNWLWGLFRNGPTPYDPLPYSNVSYGYGYAPYSSYGYGLDGYGMTATTPLAATPTAPAVSSPTVSTPVPTTQSWNYGTPNWYSANPYQTVGYSASNDSNYYTAPSYWYGR